MLVLSEPAGDHIRVVRGYFRNDDWYFSDCYYLKKSFTHVSFSGGIVYKTKWGKLDNHHILLPPDHAHYKQSRAYMHAFPWVVFATELAESELSSVTINGLVTRDRHPDPQCFYSLFDTPNLMTFEATLMEHGNLQAEYTSLIEPSDLGKLWRCFLWRNGNLCQQGRFSECLSNDKYTWQDPINGFMEKMARAYYPTGRTHDIIEAKLDLCNVQVHVEQGRYITVRVLTCQEQFALKVDQLDIKPFLIGADAAYSFEDY